MPAFFRELCLLDGPTKSLVASSSTAVLASGALTEIESRDSSLSRLQLDSAGGGVSVCESAFDGFKATPESSSSSFLMIATGGYSAAIGAGGTKSTSLVMIIEWLQYTLY